MNQQNLIAHLQALAGCLDADSRDLAAHLSGLSEALRAAVSGSVGFQVTIVHSGHPVTLTFTIAEQDHGVVSSLRVPLPLLSGVYEPGSRAVFYSTVHGAFVDLAADLTYVLRPVDHVDALAIDVDLPFHSADSAVSGLDALAALHRAAGILIEQGHHPDTAHQALAKRAAADGLSTLAFALQLLGR